MSREIFFGSTLSDFEISSRADSDCDLCVYPIEYADRERMFVVNTFDYKVWICKRCFAEMVRQSSVIQDNTCSQKIHDDIKLSVHFADGKSLDLSDVKIVRTDSGHDLVGQIASEGSVRVNVEYVDWRVEKLFCK